MWSRPGGGRTAGGRVVGLLRPAGDRHGVGLVGEQVAHEQPPPHRHLGEVRGDRRGVEEQAQVDRAGGDHRDQRGAPVGQHLGGRQLRRRPRTRSSTARSARPPPSPFVAGVAPATSPNGITPTSIGATALAPASSSARAVGVGTGASCRGVLAVATGIQLPYACRRVADLCPPRRRGAGEARAARVDAPRLLLPRHPGRGHGRRPGPLATGPGGGAGVRLGPGRAVRRQRLVPPGQLVDRPGACGCRSSTTARSS